MSGGDGFCPVEDCEDNQGGFCVKGREPALGYAATAFYMPMSGNFMAPFVPAMTSLPGNVLVDGQPQPEDEWGTWRNCPKRKENDLKK